jgi:hypothetical protein
MGGDYNMIFSLILEIKVWEYGGRFLGELRRHNIYFYKKLKE